MSLLALTGDRQQANHYPVVLTLHAHQVLVASTGIRYSYTVYGNPDR